MLVMNIVHYCGITMVVINLLGLAFRLRDRDNQYIRVITNVIADITLVLAVVCILLIVIYKP